MTAVGGRVSVGEIGMVAWETVVTGEPGAEQLAISTIPRQRILYMVLCMQASFLSMEICGSDSPSVQHPSCM